MFMEKILTVTALNENIKRLLEERFDTLWVAGEISNLRKPASGHVYFTLKDEKSQIRAVIFRHPHMQRSFSWSRSSRFDLEEGMSVICCARLSVYHPRGEYQLVVETIEPKGLGALQMAFEQLKARLQAEGLFDPAHKKPVPFLPRRIGVITSPTGAVIQDILHITARRFPSVDILIAPVRVQGSEAPAEIVRAILDIQEVGNVDVIILARGGGSLEDLAPFNDEGVARAIYCSRIPVISAVGHEIDFTIADFVADLRAPTPSAAAELVVPVKKELTASLNSLYMRMLNHQRRMMEKSSERIALLDERLKDPRRRIDDFRLMVDDRMERLRSALDHRRAMLRPKLHHLEVRLQHVSPRSMIRERRFVLENLKKDMIAGWNRTIGQLKNRVSSDMAVLDNLSPLSVLKRGYSIVKKLPEGFIVREAGSVSINSELAVKVSSGSLRAKVTEICRE
jgi:exodeoxyribonuclease VII large subunit